MTTVGNKCLNIFILSENGFKYLEQNALTSFCFSKVIFGLESSFLTALTAERRGNHLIRGDVAAPPWSWERKNMPLGQVIPFSMRYVFSMIVGECYNRYMSNARS